MKKHLLIFAIIILPIYSIAQYDPIPITNIEEFILREISKDSTSDLTKDFSFNFSFGIGNHKHTFNSIILKSKNKNYILIGGTNRVYQFIKDDSKNGFKIFRIDSTKFYGDNFNLIPFYRKDTIFQYGGYGFWQNRDFFSYYRYKTNDWEFFPTLEGLQSIYTLHFYDKVKDQFYIVGRYHQDSHKSLATEFRDSAYCYDFKTDKWLNLGKIASNIFTPPLDFNAYWTNENGIFLMRLNNIYLMDISQNKYYELKKEYHDKFISFFNKNSIAGNNNILLSISDSLMMIWGVQNKYSINKLKLTPDDFDYENPKPIYIPNKYNIPLKKYGIYTLLFILLSSSVLFYYKKKPKSNITHPPKTQSDSSQIIHHLYTQLNQSEKDLLGEIISSSIKGKKLDNNDINKILGVQNKQPMIQKTRRSLAITKINDVYMNLSGSTSALIKRSKDEQDKRSFNYFINTKISMEIDSILKVIKENAV